MRIAVTYRPRSAAPIEVAPMLMEGLGQWVEKYSDQFLILEFFVAGGGLVIADFEDAAALNRVVAENPFTPYMEVDIRPVVDPGVAMGAFRELAAAFAAPAAG
jgi:hypothetical protein